MNLSRIFVYSQPAPSTLDACAARLVELLRELRTISDGLSFRVSGATEPLDSRRACAEALARAESVGNLGEGREVRAYDLRLVARPSNAMVARLRLVMGLAVDLGAIGQGNRAELTLQTAREPDPELTLDALIALAQATEADRGFAGGKSVPFVPSSGSTPAVGWMTFLSKRTLPESPAIAAPARVVPLGDGGIVIVAQAGAVDESRRDDLAHVQAVRDALGSAVLQVPPLPFLAAAPA